MTGKKKRQTGPAGQKKATVALSLCLLAGVIMFGMYTVGKTEEQQKKLEQEMADAENAAKAREQELAAAKSRRQRRLKKSARRRREAHRGIGPTRKFLRRRRKRRQRTRPRTARSWRVNTRK